MKKQKGLWQRVISMMILIAMFFGLVPNSTLTAMASEHTNQVRVVIENNTWTTEKCDNGEMGDSWMGDYPIWEGTLVDTWVDIDENSSMMSCIVSALDEYGYEQTGAEYNYISSINGLGEMGATLFSGWMGTLNDWFVNEGFEAFTVAEGKLQAGDMITIMYTCEGFGEDLGGTFNNNDKTIKEMKTSIGELSPVWNKDIDSYTLTLPEGTKGVQLIPTASNKNFLIKQFVGQTEYKRTETIPVVDGTEITVECGRIGWPSMNNQVGGTSDSEPGKVYTIVVDIENNNQTSADKVIEKIKDIGTVTLERESAITEARKAYDELTVEQKALVTNYKTLTDAEAKLAELKRPTVDKDFETILDKTLNKQWDMFVEYPSTGSIGGEWLALSLARYPEVLSSMITKYGEEAVKDAKAAYYAKVVEYVENEINPTTMKLHKVKSTEHDRLIVALTSLGYDVTNVAGYNLLTALGDFDYVKKQGLNGPIWALIALDSHDYVIPTKVTGNNQTTRQGLIDYILEQQAPNGGGWNLYGKDTTYSDKADVDITGMAIQALAPYYNSNTEVKVAVDKAIGIMSDKFKVSGDYGSVESIAQIVVALCALNINPDTDERFVMDNGVSLLDAMLNYSVDSQDGFKHVLNGTVNQMATEQSLYAAAAYKRYTSGMNRLYDMTDVIVEAPYSIVISMIEGIGTITREKESQIQAARTAYDSLSKEEKDKISEEIYEKLISAERELKELFVDINKVITLINDIRTVEYTTSVKNKIAKARAAYNSLSSDEKIYITNYNTLIEAEKKYAKLGNAHNVIELINSIGTVDKNSKSTIEKARKAYNALTAEEKVLVENYEILTAAERKYNSLSVENSSDKKPSENKDVIENETTNVIGDGDTKVVINDVTYMVEKEPAEVMNKISELTGLTELTTTDVNSIIEAFKLYDSMTDSEKAQVFNYDDLEAALNLVASQNHKDDVTGIKIEGASWNVKMEIVEVSSGEAYEIVSKSIGNNEIIGMWDFNFTDILTGEKYKHASKVKIQIPKVDISGYDQVRMVHFSDDGKIEYYDCDVEDGYIILETSDFSHYALIGGRAEATQKLPTETDNTELDNKDVILLQSTNSMPWIWICIAGIGIVVLLFAVVMKVQMKKKKEE